MTAKRVQAERWLSLLKKVLESAENDLANNPNTNDETYKRALSWLDVLMKGNALTKKQAANFITTIRARVPGKATYVWTGPIQLSDKQIWDENREQRMARFTRANRSKTYATNLMMEAVQAKMEDLDWTDVDVLAAFQAHIASFDLNAAPAVVEEVEKIQVPAEPVEPNPMLDELMARFPTQRRFPSNTWSDEHMGAVHQTYAPISRDCH